MMDRMSIDEAIRAVVEASTSEWQSCLPGRVEAFDEGEGTCTVQPLVKRKGKASAATSRPVLTGVPVLWPGGGGAEIRWTLAAGDAVLLLFASADTSAWRQSGEEADPASARRFSLSDAVCLPVRRPSSTPPAVSIVLGAGGTVRIGSGTVDLVDAVQRLAQAVATGTVAAEVGGPLSTASDANTIAIALAPLVSS
jgi:hypothetical protein